MSANARDKGEEGKKGQKGEQECGWRWVDGPGSSKEAYEEEGPRKEVNFAVVFLFDLFSVRKRIASALCVPKIRRFSQGTFLIP